jgi:hypothetical protein
MCSSVTIGQRQDYPRIQEEDYFRRAPRANELFYVFDETGVRAAIQAFLAQYNSGQTIGAAATSRAF